ncbi:MAG: sugar phosphate nucleotidyltransferase [Lachnospiraceae bacterium]|nr:sugar phosphate nucleotidyltransferase [Lachnospiraceae bacterium]
MIRKEMIAMLLAGRKEGGLGILTDRVSKAALPFGGKYRIIDFPLSNCIHSGIDTAGIITRYRPVRLNAHIGIGASWDMDKSYGGVTVLPTYEECSGGEAIGTVQAVYRNYEYMLQYHPDYVLISPADCLYKMDYEVMLDFLKAMDADVAICAIPAKEGEEAEGLIYTDAYGYILPPGAGIPSDGRKYVSTEIYIFRWTALKEMLLALGEDPTCEFATDMLPFCMRNGSRLCAYEFTGYFERLDSPAAYWKANLELLIGEVEMGLNLNERFWKIYTNAEQSAPVFFTDTSAVSGSIIGEGADIKGQVTDSVIGAGATVEAGAVIRNSVVMPEAYIGSGAVVDMAIICEGAGIGDHAVIGTGEFAQSALDPDIYNSDLTIIGENAVVPPHVKIGRNAVVSGVTDESDYPGGELASGCAIAPDQKEGDKA